MKTGWSLQLCWTWLGADTEYRNTVTALMANWRRQGFYSVSVQKTFRLLCRYPGFTRVVRYVDTAQRVCFIIFVSCGMFWLRLQFIVTKSTKQMSRVLCQEAGFKGQF